LFVNCYRCFVQFTVSSDDFDSCQGLPSAMTMNEQVFSFIPSVWDSSLLLTDTGILHLHHISLELQGTNTTLLLT